MPPIGGWKTGVYLITNEVNGKRYVGSAAHNFQTRWALHRHELQHQKHHSSHLQRAWNKYGSESFKFSVLERCPPADCLVREQYWLDELKTYDRSVGYNLSAIAGSTLGVKHAADAKSHHHTQEHIEKRAAARRGKKWTPEMKAKASKSKQNISALTRLKMSMAKKSRPYTPRSLVARAKAAAKHRGMKRSPEAVENMRKAQQKRFSTES